MKDSTWRSQRKSSPLGLFLLAVFSSLIPLTAQAQVSPDGTTSTTVNQNGNDFAIEQGDRVGDNLFHSFDEFSVPTGGSAGFNNADSIANIFSRVTGGDISNIDGMLSANGTANLFLINPNGIIFGNNASLDIGGSFYGSTADSLLFDGDTEFSASNPQAAPLLEVSIPIGLSFRDNPGDIIANPGSILSVDSEQTLALIGGNITFDNAIASGDLMGTNNTIEIGGLTGAGIVSFQEDGRLVFPPDVARGDISLSNTSTLITASRGGGGSVFVYAQDFNLATDSTIGSVVFLDLDTTRASSGDVIIDAQGDVAIDGANSETITAVFNNIIDDTQGMGTGIGEAGNIEISGRNISIINGASVDSVVSNPNQSENTSEPNRSSTIILTAEENLLIADGNARFPSSVSNRIDFGNGNGGAIELTAQNLLVRNGAIISSTIQTFAEGNAGDIDLAIDNIVLAGGGQISATSFGGGDGGNINITADRLSVDGSGDIISVDSLEDIISVDSLEDIILVDSLEDIISANNISSPSSISSSTPINVNNIVNDNLRRGEAGNINISTSSLAITNGAEVVASSDSLGDGGDIQIVAREEIAIDGGVDREITTLGNNTGSFFNTLGQRNAGNIEIDTPTLKVTNNGNVSSDTLNEGNAGNITIKASELEVSNEGFISTDASADSTGSGGDLTIETENFKVTGGGQISVATLGEGNAGNLSVRANDSIEIGGTDELGFRSGLFATATNSTGNGGELNIVTQDLAISDQGTINVGNFPSSENNSTDSGIGEPGNLSIQADSIRLENDASIEAATQSPVGDGANINIASEDITLDNNALISARAFEDADGGNLSIESGFVLAFPDGNNDLVARADRGNGGRISIDTEAIFGLEERLSEPTNFTNDIDASSEFGLQGDFSLNTPDFDPTTGLIELPAAVGDASDQISQNPCQQGVGSQFIVTGKGGLPPSPTETLNGGGVEVDLVEPLPQPLSYESKGARLRQEKEQTSKPNSKNQISEALPAMGWVFNDKGEVTLTAYSNIDTESVRSLSNSTTCNANTSP